MFLVLLRMCIGWHFLYEGLYKLDKTAKGVQPWSAQGYLRVAEGPLRDTFLAMVDDPYGLDRLNEAYLFPEWERKALAFADYHDLDAVDRAKIYKKLRELRKQAREYLYEDDDSTPVEAHAKPDEPTRARIDVYREEVATFRATDRKVTGRKPRLSYEQERLQRAKGKLSGSRATVTGPIAAMSADLDAFLLRLRPDIEAAAAGERPKEASKLAEFMSSFCGLPWMDNLTMWGITAIGVCLLAGLFSRAAALGGIAFLAMIYMSQPPWPWLPPNPMATGHYLFIDMIAIEAIAMVALVFIPTGRWAGLDALIHRWIIGREGRVAEDTAREELAQVTA